MTYKIPEDIKCKISEEFYSAMRQRLRKVFGDRFFYLHFGKESLSDCTNIWDAIFEAICESLGMIWLYRYFEKLEPPESDMFDKEIEEELLRGYKNHAKLS